MRVVYFSPEFAATASYSSAGRRDSRSFDPEIEAPYRMDTVIKWSESPHVVSRIKHFRVDNLSWGQVRILLRQRNRKSRLTPNTVVKFTNELGATLTEDFTLLAPTSQQLDGRYLVRLVEFARA